jgi:flagellar motor protein MotB
VEAVVIFPEKRATRFLESVNPDLYVKGGDYQADQLDKDELEAVNKGGGQVQVLGHTDNEPINNAQFPSNQALSQVRAQRAMNILVAANGSANRFTARGVADAEPIAPNTTEAGRAENRRIEIILLRRAR